MLTFSVAIHGQGVINTLRDTKRMICSCPWIQSTNVCERVDVSRVVVS